MTDEGSLDGSGLGRDELGRDELAGARTLLHGFDLGPLPALDLDDVVRRGHRRRRAAAVQRVAAVVVLVLVAGVGLASVHAHLQGTPAAVTTTSPSPTPTPSPSTAAERVAAAMNAVASADSVHIVAQLGGPNGGSMLDVVVTKNGAVGTFTHQAKTAEYLGVNGALYMRGDALADYPTLSPSQLAAVHGRWILMTTLGQSTWMNLTELSKWFYPPHATTPTLGATKTLDGSRVLALTDQGGRIDVQWVQVDAPYRPVRVETPDHILEWTLTDWNAPPPTIPPAPTPAEVYDPSQG